MGLIVSDLREEAFDSTPSLDAIGGVPHIAVMRGDDGRRAVYFSRILPKDKDFKRLHVPSYPLDDSMLDKDLGKQLFSLGQEARLEMGGDIKILLDVSCISRPAIGQLFAGLQAMATIRPIDLCLTYSLAAYAPSPSVWAAPNRTIRPVHPAFSGWSAEGASAPVDVVVGLGYEKGKALGAVEYLEPRNRWVYVPQSPESRYLDEVKKHNKHLIESRKGSVAYYNVLSPLDTYYSLRSLVEGIGRDARPVLLPFGPKIFFAINLLVAMTNEEASVWHVSGESDEYGFRNPSRFSTSLRCRISA